MIKLSFPVTEGKNPDAESRRRGVDFRRRVHRAWCRRTCQCLPAAVDLHHERCGNDARVVQADGG